MLFERPWGPPPKDICTASCSTPVLPQAKHFTSPLRTINTHLYSSQHCRGAQDFRLRVAAPERENEAKNKSVEKPMVYQKERVEYGDGAVIKVRFNSS